MAVKLVLAGHSHVHALGVPGLAKGEAPKVVPLAHPTADVAAVIGARNGAYWTTLVEAARDRQAAIIWTGNQHYANFTFRNGPAFDFILSEAPATPIDRTAQIVPEEMVRAVFAPSITRLGELITRIHAVSPFPAIIIGTPPPKGDPVRFCANLDNSLALKASAEQQGIALTPESLTDVTVMVKLWRLLQGMFAECAAAAGAIFVPVPPTLIARGGVLADNHWADDATHTNRDYGGQMLAAVIARVTAAPLPQDQQFHSVPAGGVR